MFELRLEFPVKALLKIAGMPRSTYYYWVKTLGRPDKDAKLKTLIQAIYDEHKERYGYRQIKDKLKNQGHPVNHKKVHRYDERVRLKKQGAYEEISLIQGEDWQNGSKYFEP